MLALNSLFLAATLARAGLSPLDELSDASRYLGGWPPLIIILTAPFMVAVIMFLLITFGPLKGDLSPFIIVSLFGSLGIGLLALGLSAGLPEDSAKDLFANGVRPSPELALSMVGIDTLAIAAFLLLAWRAAYVIARRTGREDADALLCSGVVEALSLLSNPPSLNNQNRRELQHIFVWCAQLARVDLFNMLNIGCASNVNLLRDRCVGLGAYFDDLVLWAAFPRADTALHLQASLAQVLRCLVSGEFDTLPNARAHMDRIDYRKSLGLLCSATLPAVTLLGLWLTGVQIPNSWHDGLLVGASIWALINILSVLDPNISSRVSVVKELFPIFNAVQLSDKKRQ